MRAVTKEPVMTRNTHSTDPNTVNRQGANALIAATITFLQTNNISKQLILDSVREHYGSPKSKPSIRQYRRLARAYEEMGIVMSTWFSSARFLDKECQPQPLAVGSGPQSIHSLVRASKVSISTPIAIELMRRSPSIGMDANGNLVALRREFVLPDFAVPRAALVIERYLDTLHRNSSRNNKRCVLLLERNCHVPEVRMTAIAPVLRDIKKRGSAYIDSVNGDIESLRHKGARGKGSGEMSVHIFAWTRLSRHRKVKHPSK
jgi:hypothetical protein